VTKENGICRPAARPRRAITVSAAPSVARSGVGTTSVILKAESANGKAPLAAMARSGRRPMRQRGKHDSARAVQPNSRLAGHIGRGIATDPGDVGSIHPQFDSIRARAETAERQEMPLVAVERLGRAVQGVVLAGRFAQAAVEFEDFGDDGVDLVLGTVADIAVGARSDRGDIGEVRKARCRIGEHEAGLGGIDAGPQLIGCAHGAIDPVPVMRRDSDGVPARTQQACGNVELSDPQAVRYAHRYGLHVCAIHGHRKRGALRQDRNRRQHPKAEAGPRVDLPARHVDGRHHARLLARQA
jgi:hypothetical protein